MKKYIWLLPMVLILILFPKTTFSKDYKIYDVYKVNNLTFTSYSKSWNESKLKELYLELLNNFHGEEFDYLSNIYIYPDNPEGVNGHYYDNVFIEDGKYIFGYGAYIKLFNGDVLNTVKKIAPVLAHEYGHHYVTFNMINYENIYYNDVNLSEYAKIRQLEKYPVQYIEGPNDYLYYWDISEILADDYVQLLGSYNAKGSTDFKDVEELLKEEITEIPEYKSSFNLKPQINPYIPLAVEVEGLYLYFLKMAGFTNVSPNVIKKPVFSDIQVSKALNGEFTYKIKWTKASGIEPVEYTLVMYHKTNPFSPIPIKTVTSKEPLEATFGSYSYTGKNNKPITISNVYEGEYTLKLYIKDVRGFIYESEPIVYNFDNSIKDLQTEQTTTEKTTFKKYTNFIKKKQNKQAIVKNTVVGPTVSQQNGILNSVINSKKKK